jgi:hypothetical protein
MTSRRLVTVRHNLLSVSVQYAALLLFVREGPDSNFCPETVYYDGRVRSFRE